MKIINNTLLYLLIGCILILSACAKSPVTPTDVTQTEVSSEISVENSVTSQETKNKEDPPVVSSVPKTEPSAEKTVSSVPREESKEQEKPAVSVPEEPIIDYVKWGTDSKEHYWEDRENIRFEYPSSFLIDSVLCHTYDDFTRYLQENGYPMACAADYPSSYFETQSLLLFEGRDADGGWHWVVESLALEDNTLQISLLHKRSKNMATQMAVYRIYQIQLKEKPTEVENLHFTVTQQREKDDGKYQTEKTFVREFSVP